MPPVHLSLLLLFLSLSLLLRSGIITRFFHALYFEISERNSRRLVVGM